ncbi:MAG: hypothetical protein ACLSCE_10375 [Bacteroides cellulosilyticus]
MITLNKLAVKCYRTAIKRGKIGRHSSPKAIITAISKEWRELCEATEYRSNHIPKYSECEEEAADIIIASLTYLQRIGCRDIEQLIKDKINFNAQRED